MADIKNIDVFQTVTSVSFEVEPNTDIININKVTTTGYSGVPNLQDVTDEGATTTNPITANSFIKSGGTGANVLLDNGSTTPLTSIVGTTDLSYTSGISNGIVNSNTGTDATIPLADGTNAGLFSATEKTKLSGIASGAEVNVNADWNAVSGDAEILNKPTGLATTTYVDNKDNSQQLQLNYLDRDNSIFDAFYLRTIADGGTVEASNQLLSSLAVLRNISYVNQGYTQQINADKFVKLGGAADEYLMADGSVSYGGGGGGGATNLTTTQTISNFTINSNTGTDATVPLGNGTLAGATLNDYTTAEKNKLAGIATGAEVNVNADWNAVSGDAQILNKPTIPSVSGFVPYTGATANVDLGTHSITVKDLIVNHSSGSGDAATITKGGSGEALKVVKTSGSGNAASITGGVTLLDELHLNTDLADTYIASATVWNAKQDSLGYTPANDASVVHLTGSETIAGTKTFSSNPKIPVNFGNSGIGALVIENGTGQLEVATNYVYPNTTEISYVKGVTSAIQTQFIGKVSTNTAITGATKTKITYDAKGLVTAGADIATTDISDFNSSSRAQTEAELIAGTNITITPSGTGATRQLTIASTGGGSSTQSAYTVLANNTNASAVATEQVYKDIAEQTYSGTITWGTTAPTTLLANNYQWQQVGKLVTVTIKISYNTGQTNSQVTLSLPTDMPTPASPTGFTGALDILYYGTGVIFSSTSTVPSTARVVLLRRNSANTGYEFLVAQSSASSIKVVNLTLQYFAQ